MFIVGPWHLVGQIDKDRVIKARTVKRRPETLKWDREFFDAMNLVPWLIDGQVIRLEAALEAKRAMKKDHELKRKRNQHLKQSKPFNHTTE